MRAIIIVQSPLPPNIAPSYGQLQYANYGVCAWQYNLPVQGTNQNFLGPVHWINFPYSCFEPDYPNPVGFQYWFHANIKANVQVIPQINTQAADAYIAGTAVNLLLGKGMPLLLTP
jgi:hypothetical protein